MPKRLAFYLTLQLLLCTSAFAQSPSVTANETTLWDHNGSVMYLIVSGLSREFYYKEPRPGMLDVGARPDSLLFRGQIKDGRFSGTAYIFNLHCGQVPFDIKGPILDNNERVVLTGQAPRVGRNCQTHGYYTSNLEFKLLKTTDVAQPAGPAFTTQAAIEESKPEVPWSDAGELEPSAQPPTTAQAPSVEQPKPDVPAREVGEPKQPGNPSALPSMTDQLPIAAQDSGGKKRLAPLLMALSVLLPVLSILFLIGILKSIGRGCANRKRIFGLEPLSGWATKAALATIITLPVSPERSHRWTPRFQLSLKTVTVISATSLAVTETWPTTDRNTGRQYQTGL